VLEHPEVNQLFRNHALAVAVLHHSMSRYQFAATAVIRHPGDTSCAASVAAYTRLLRGEVHVPLLDLPLDEVVHRLRPVVAATSWATWLDAFEKRYVDLDASSALATGQTIC
jgi:hypothetical protein